MSWRLELFGPAEVDPEGGRKGDFFRSSFEFFGARRKRSIQTSKTPAFQHLHIRILAVASYCTFVESFFILLRPPTCLLFPRSPRCAAQGRGWMDDKD